MARQVLPIAGAIIGGIYGGPGGAQAGYAIGALVGNAVDPLVVQGPRIGDTAVQTSAEGAYRSIIYGTAAVSGNLIWTGPKIVRKSKDQAGKGGGPVTVTERLFQSFAIRVCEGPVSGILRIWEDEKLVYDVRPGSSIPEDTSNFATRFVLHLGGEDQFPDSEIEGVEGVGNAPAYRGSCYVVFPKYDLTDRRGSIPQYRFEVVARDADITWSPKAITDDGYFTGTFSSVDFHDVDTFAGLNVTWQKTLALSPDGMLAAGAFASAPTFRVFRFERDSNAWVPFPIVGAMPTGTTFTAAFSSDGKWLAVGSSGAHPLTLYRVDDDSIVFHAYPDIDPPTIHEVKWQPGQLTLAISCNSFEPVWLYTYFPTTEQLSFQRKCVTLTGSGGTARRIAWRPDGGMIAYVDTIRIWVINTAESPMPMLYRGIMPAGANGSAGIGWSQYLDFFYLFSTASPYISIMRFLSVGDDVFELIPYDAPTTAFGPVRDAQLSYDGRYVVTAQGSGASGGLEIFQTNLIESMTSIETVAGRIQNRVAVAEGPSTGQGEAVPGTLSAIVSDICDRCTLAASAYDVSELGDQVDGFILSGSYSGVSAINALRAPFFFDISEYDRRIWFPKRGKPVVATLTFDDLVDEPADPVRQDSIELPAKLHLEYQNSITGYETAKATSSRSSSDTRVTGETSVSVPVVLDSTTAQQVVTKLHKVTWTDLEGEIDLTISDKFIGLVAADNIGLSLRQHVTRLRIERIDHSLGQLKLSCKVDRQSAYSAQVTGVPLREPTPPPTSIVGATALAMLDIPALNDSNDRLLIYAGLSGQTSAWYGAVLQMSTDGGASWQDVGSTRGGTAMGVLRNAVSAASPYYTDSTNTVVVGLYNPDDELEGITQEQLLSEGGAFAIEYDEGDGQRWEILQGRDVVQNSSGDWEVSHLLRGRLNSKAVAHGAGSRVVFLDGVISIDMQSASVGQVVQFRAVSLGTSPELAVAVPVLYRGWSQTEWPVAHVLLTRDGDTVSASTVPRHRLGTEDRPLRSVNWDGYRWTATDGSNSLSISGSDPFVSFSTSGWSSPVTVTVSQANRITGASPTVSEQIE